MRCDSPFPLLGIRPPAAIPEKPRLFLPASFFSIMSANGIIDPSNMAIWNSTCRRRLGWSATTTPASRRWQNVFWSPVTYLVGILLFVAGLAIVRAHNRWIRGWPVLVTLVGWAAIFGGLFRMLAPEAQRAFRMSRRSECTR